MSYSLEEAKFVIYDTVLHRRVGTALEDTPVIFDEDTIEKPWGWIFFYNNERYRQTGDFPCQWVGQGPIFFNRDNGEVRVFGSGCKLDDELYDYEMELAAKNGSWCLWLTADQERKTTIVKLKSAFSLTTSDAMRMVPKLPHCLFSGVRRHLDWVARQLTEHNIATDVTLEESPDVAQSIFTLPEGMINPSLAQAYHKRWNVVS
jgi:hypothetical protein